MLLVVYSVFHSMKCTTTAEFIYCVTFFHPIKSQKAAAVANNSVYFFFIIKSNPWGFLCVLCLFFLHMFCPLKPPVDSSRWMQNVRQVLLKNSSCLKFVSFHCRHIHAECQGLLQSWTWSSQQSTNPTSFIRRCRKVIDSIQLTVFHVEQSITITIWNVCTMALEYIYLIIEFRA